MIVHNLYRLISYMYDEGGGAEAPWALQKRPPSLQICRITSKSGEIVSVSLVTSPSLCHFVSRPTFWSLLAVFIFCLPLIAQPTKNQNISLHSKLRYSLKNHLIDKFERLIHSIDPKLFFVKSLHKAGIRKRGTL